MCRGECCVEGVMCKGEWCVEGSVVYRGVVCRESGV